MNHSNRRFAYFAILLSIELLLIVVPFLGYVPLGFINATTLHLPVIVAGMMLGKKEGMLLGLVFGISSVIKNTLEPNLTSFLFSPFFSLNGTSGNFMSLVIAIVPRVLIGYIAGLISEKLPKFKYKYALASFISSMVNTCLVMGLAYLFFRDAYALAKGVSVELVMGMMLMVVFTSGLAEAILASVICPLIMKVKRNGVF